LILNINFEDIQINIYNIKFLGLTIDNTLSCKNQIKQVSSKLSSAGYSIRPLESVMSQERLRTIYFSNVHSTMLYGIIFGTIRSIATLFLGYKTQIRIVMNAEDGDSVIHCLKS